MTVILKLTQHDGSEFGYMGLNKKKDRFIGGVDKSDATKFKQEDYSKLEDSYYYEMADKKGYYLDIKASSSVLFPDRPIFSIDASTIVAWKEIDHQLHAVIGGEDTTKVVSRSNSDEDSKTLYGNSLIGDGSTTSCKVEVIKV